ncbi:transposase [Streptomyces levis]
MDTSKSRKDADHGCSAWVPRRTARACDASGGRGPQASGRAGAIKRIADQLDVRPEALRCWVKRAEAGEDTVPGTTSGDAARIAELEREVKELRRANAIAVRAMSNSARR